MVRRYLINLWIWISQTLNTWTGGDPDETLSSRCHKRMQEPRPKAQWRVLYWTLNTLHPGHTASAEEVDEGRWEIFNEKRRR